MVRGEAWQASMQSAKMWRRCAAFIAFVASSFVAHATVGVLLHQQVMCAWVRSANCSRTIHCRRSPPFLSQNLWWCCKDWFVKPCCSGCPQGTGCATQLEGVLCSGQTICCLHPFWRHCNSCQSQLGWALGHSMVWVGSWLLGEV